MKLRSWVVNVLLSIVTLLVLIIMSTIETLGNTNYNKFLFVSILVITLIIAILKKYAKFN